MPSGDTQLFGRSDLAWTQFQPVKSRFAKPGRVSANSALLPEMQNDNAHPQYNARDLRIYLREIAATTAQALCICSASFSDPDADFGDMLEEGIHAADVLNQQACGLLNDTQLSAKHQQQVERILKSASDLRCALSAIQSFTQIARLLGDDNEGAFAFIAAAPVAEAASGAARQIADALEKKGEPRAALEAARTYSAVESACIEALTSLQNSGYVAAHTRRMLRAGLWSVLVAAECMARVAARFALPAGKTA